MKQVLMLNIQVENFVFIKVIGSAQDVFVDDKDEIQRKDFQSRLTQKLI